MITIFDCLCHSIKYIQQTTVSLVNSLWFIGYFCNIKAIFHYLKLCIQHFLHSNAMLVKTLYIIQYCTHSLLSTSHKNIWAWGHCLSHHMLNMMKQLSYVICQLQFCYGWFYNTFFDKNCNVVKQSGIIVIIMNGPGKKMQIYLILQRSYRISYNLPHSVICNFLLLKLVNIWQTKKLHSCASS